MSVSGFPSVVSVVVVWAKLSDVIARNVATSLSFFVIVYVFVVFPSSAVTTTLAVFEPSFKDTFPVPVTLAFESAAVPYTFTSDTSFGTSTLYE